MENRVDYEALYLVQDKVLQAVFAQQTGFYLTGGTCLHRFHLKQRYSDDLDFFCNDHDLFRDYLREALAAVRDATGDVRVSVDTRDFARVLVDGGLKVDFVNDRVHRVGRPLVDAAGYRIDTVDNILSNKITAVLGRDEPKDVFDIVSIALSRGIDWPVVLDDAARKCVFEKDLLVDRLAAFPVALLDGLTVRDPAYLAEVKAGLPAVIEAILQGYG